MKFKCPVCANIFVFDAGRQQINCPACETAFNQRKIRELFARQKQQKSLSPTTGPTAPTQPKPADDALTDSPRFRSDITSDTDLVNSNSAKLIQMRHRRSDRRLIALTVLFVLACGLFIGLLLVMQSPPSAPPGSTAAVSMNEPETQDEPEETELTPPVDFDRGGEGIDLGLNNRLPLAPFHELDSPELVAPKPPNTYKTARILRDCWFKVQPFLFEVRAETPTGTRYATGTMIDSRGWLLTSYRAVAGADRIDIRPSSKSAADPRTKTAMMDPVRGIIAVDQGRDLIVLAFNSRFVMAYNDLPIATDDRIVGSQYLIQCQPPTAAYPYSTVETRVDRIALLNEMSPDGAEPMKRIGLLDDAVRWIVHQQDSPLAHGAPLFNDSGQLVAINSATGSGADVLAIPARHIAAIKQSGGESIKPLPVPGVSFAATGTEDDDFPDDPANSLPDSELSVVHSQSPLRDLSESLNRFGMACESFSWHPASTEEALQLRQFAQYLILAREQSGSSDPAVDTETLSEQVAKWRGAIDRSLGIESAANRETQIAFNRLVNIASGPDSDLFFGYALVEYSAMESPRSAISDSSPGDTVVLRFVGGGGQIIANLSTDWPPLPPDSPWLVIGRKLAGEVRLRNRSNQDQSLQPAVVYFVMQADTP